MDSNADNLLNSSRICRFCLSKAGVLSPIFEQGDLNSLPLSSKIMAFVSVQVFVDDGLPSLICHRCLYQVEKSYDFKTQCEASDAMLRKHLMAFQSNMQSKLPVNIQNSESTPAFDSFNLAKFQKSVLHTSVFNDSPFKRKRGRPRKEENLIFYGSPVDQHMEPRNGLLNYADSEIKIVDGIESLVTVVDPRSEMLSNSDDDNKAESDAVPEGQGDKSELPAQNGEGNSGQVLDSLAIAKAKAKEYMEVVIEVDKNGSRSRKHLCKGCGKTFGHCSDLRKHVLVHTGERPFHCQICPKTFSRSTNLNKHMKVHTGQKPFFCTDCPKAFATKGDLQRHLITHSGIKPFSCHFCSQCFSRKDKLTRHLKLHEGGSVGKVNFKCTHCTAVYHSKIDLGNHIESMHSTEERADDEEGEENVKSSCSDLYLDDKLDKSAAKDEDSSSDKDALFTVKKEESSPEANHEEVESIVINVDPFQLDSDMCDQASCWPEEKIKMDSDRPNGLAPSQDGEIDIKISKLIVKDINKNIDSPQCKVCSKKFIEASHLRSHMITHSMLKPHKCTLCEKSFTRRRELLRHESVHTGLKPFKCPTCSKAFSRKDKLARHEKIHNGMKKSACQMCPSAGGFSKADELVLHRGSAHPDGETGPKGEASGPEQAYGCELCPGSFPDSVTYEKHVRNHEVPDGARCCSPKQSHSEEEGENLNADMQ